MVRKIFLDFLTMPSNVYVAVPVLMSIFLSPFYFKYPSPTILSEENSSLVPSSDFSYISPNLNSTEVQIKETFNYSASHALIMRTNLMRRIDFLSKISEDSSTSGTTRPYLSMAGTKARHALLDMMNESGLDARIDPIGNVIGDLECKTSRGNDLSHRKYLLIASHFDTVPHGGKWDGVYGIISGIAVSEILSADICDLPFNLRVVGFDDEEGASGFGITNAGAKAFTGMLNISIDVSDYNGFKNKFASMMMPHPYSQADIDSHLAQAISRSNLSKHEYIAGLELHIEQGPVLEQTGHSVGSVAAIAGQTRLEAVWKGTRGHAGTVPMSGRRDALVAAAEGILHVNNLAKFSSKHLNVSSKAEKHNLVATVGKLNIDHPGSNIIPGSVSMTVDLRSPNDIVRKSTVRNIIEGFNGISKDAGVTVEVRVVHEVDAVRMAKWITNIIQQNVDFPSPMISGAGHDSQFVSRITDTGMIFVRCRNGISHSPEEFVHEDDAYRGALSLLHSVESIALAMQ